MQLDLKREREQVQNVQDEVGDPHHVLFCCNFSVTFFFLLLQYLLLLQSVQMFAEKYTVDLLSVVI